MDATRTDYTTEMIDLMSRKVKERARDYDDIDIHYFMQFGFGVRLFAP